MDAEAASAARDLIEIARTAANWIKAKPATTVAKKVGHLYADDLLAAATRLSAVTPPIPSLRAQLLQSLATTVRQGADSVSDPVMQADLNRAADRLGEVL